MYKLTTRWFARWAKKMHISDEMLLKSIKDLEEGLSTVNLGGGLYKVRVASVDSGKSSAYRTIIVFKKDDRALMVYGFAKEFLAFLDDDLQELVQQNKFISIGDNDER